MCDFDSTTDHGARLSDAELDAMALAASPDTPLSVDAVPWYGNTTFQRGLLPDWYMPRPIAATRGRATKIVIVTVVVAFLVLDAFGLCITSGFLSLA